MIKIKIHEKKAAEVKEAVKGTRFLSKEYEGMGLPSLYTADSLAVFKGNDLEPDLAWDAEYLPLDVAEATVDGDFLFVALKDEPGKAMVSSAMKSDYKKLALDEPLELVDYLDVKSIRDSLFSIVSETQGHPWNLGYNLGDINDLSDMPGIVDAAYTDDGAVSLNASAFGYAVANMDGSDIRETESPEEALSLVEGMFKQFE